MPARSVCLVTLSLSEAGPGRFGRQVSLTDLYHTIPYHTITSPLFSQAHSATVNLLRKGAVDAVAAARTSAGRDDGDVHVTNITSSLQQCLANVIHVQVG